MLSPVKSSGDNDNHFLWLHGQFLTELAPAEEVGSKKELKRASPDIKKNNVIIAGENYPLPVRAVLKVLGYSDFRRE